MEPEHHLAAHKYGPQREFLYQDWVLDSYKAGAANLNCNPKRKRDNSLMFGSEIQSKKKKKIQAKHSSNLFFVFHKLPLVDQGSQP